MTTPRLFLDVDGVLSPLADEPAYPGPAHWEDLFGGMHFSVHLLDRLKDLHRREIVRIEWLTTWEDAAATTLAPRLGLPDWPVHTSLSAPAQGSDWWKERVARAALDAGERVIWCDDHIKRRASPARLRRTYGERLLLIIPDPAMGLTPGDLDAIEDWVARPQPAAKNAPHTPATGG